MRTKILLAATAMLTSPLAACATDAPRYRAPIAEGYGAAPAQRHEDDGLLSEPPANAKAGQCFAKVVVPGQPIYGPPVAQAHVRWVQTPPQPGTIGPVWCQVWEQGYQPSVTYTPERYGWIRVICDHDATAEKIGHIQHRLHDWGYYQGGYGGKYDDATAEAVKRFQSERHIEHGGYLSYKTMEALDAAPPAPVVAPPVSYAQGYQAQGYQAQGYQAQGYQAQGYAYQAQSFAPPVYPPQPCGPNPCQGGYPQGGPGYGQGGYGQSGYAYGRTWLNWSGKRGY